MARIFRQRYTTRDPSDPMKRVTRKSKKWYIEFVDATGTRRRVPGFADKRATEHKAAMLEQEAERIRSGMLVAREVEHAATPMQQHLDDYLASAVRSPKHRDVTRARIERVVADLGWSVANEASAGSVQAWIVAQRADGMATQTGNHYARAVKSLFRWLADEGRIASNPLATLKSANADADRRRVRRSLTPVDFGRLIDAARQSLRPLHGLDGPARAVLYLTAAYTGLRSSELASLTPASIAFEPPSVTVAACYSKRRRTDVLPLHPDVAAMLRAHLAGRPADSPIFPGDWSPAHGAVLLRTDLAAAGIPFDDGTGRFDFHALRVQFITSLARANVPLVLAQRLARHSSPVLTANTYSRLGDVELAAGVSRLPALPSGSPSGSPG